MLFEHLCDNGDCAVHGIWGHRLWVRLLCGLGRDILEITRTNALGALVAMPIARSRMMPALIYARGE